MFKSLALSLFVAFAGITMASVDAHAETSGDVYATEAAAQQNAGLNSEQSQAFNHNRDFPGNRGHNGSWLVRWRDLDTGRNISGWVQSNSPTCGHGNACDCNRQNYCGQYRSGETALYWERGCRRQPTRIICDSQLQR